MSAYYYISHANTYSANTPESSSVSTEYILMSGGELSYNIAYKHILIRLKVKLYIYIYKGIDVAAARGRRR